MKAILPLRHPDVLLLALGLHLQLGVDGDDDGDVRGLAALEPPAAGDAQPAAGDGGSDGRHRGAEVQLGEGRTDHAMTQSSQPLSDLNCGPGIYATYQLQFLM